MMRLPRLFYKERPHTSKAPSASRLGRRARSPPTDVPTTGRSSTHKTSTCPEDSSVRAGAFPSRERSQVSAAAAFLGVSFSSAQALRRGAAISASPADLSLTSSSTRVSSK